MMFGFRDEFTYFECARCGCLQIVEIPADISKYYPRDYCSFGLLDDRPKGLLKRIAITLRCRHLVYNRGLIGRMICRMAPPDAALQSLGKLRLDESSRILDVGCGRGHILYQLWIGGFRNALGIDPYIESDIHYRYGLTILKRTIHEVRGSWDLVMFHHSFEHISDPVETLKRCAEMLTPGGYCLLRMPTVSSHAWRRYRENWVQMDPPRHFFLYSKRGVEILAVKAGLELTQVVYDSTEFQFWGSEQYIRNIPLNAEQSYSRNPSESIFSPSEIRHFRDEADLLNNRTDGDQAAFYLTRL